MVRDMTAPLSITLDQVAEVIAAAMGTIRSDVACGFGGNIEADAVLLNVVDELADKLGMDKHGAEFNVFLAKCDLVELIPSEAFSS